MDNHNVFANAIKVMVNNYNSLEAGLNNDQLMALEIIKHMKIELYKMNDYAGLEIQKQWHSSVKESLKEYLKDSFLQNMKKPEKSSINSTKLFKSVNRNLLESLEKSIRNIPNSILLIHKESENKILPEELYLNTRGYIEEVSKQINICYQNNCFDACSMCMRRLIEMLLVLTYQKNSKESDIIDSATGKTKSLSYIINYTQSNNHFFISKEVLDTLDEFRELGNFAAHKIQYNCYKPEIDKVKKEFRISVQELLYKSGMKK